MIERIECSAIKYPWGEVVTGFRHHHVIKAMAAKGFITVVEANNQGFMGTSGQFYTREQARSVAIMAGQIDKDFSGTLYSEDLWPGDSLPVGGKL